MRTFASSEINIIDKPLDVWDEVGRNPINDEPVHLCDLTAVVRKYNQWTKLLPRVVPFYAVKANDSLNVLGVLAALGTSFDCASKLEIEDVLGLGVPSSRIYFGNPAKPSTHIQYASEIGINLMNFDSAFELQKIKENAPKTKLVLRIHCKETTPDIRRAHKFGCDPDLEAPELLALAQALDLEVIGVSFQVEAGCLDSSIFLKSIKQSKTLFDIAKQFGFHFTLLDLGGGILDGKENCLTQHTHFINSALDTHFPANDVVIIATPGRYLVSTSGTLITHVNAKRHNFNNGTVEKIEYYINDGIYGALSSVFYEKRQMVPRPMRAPVVGEPLICSTIWGPTCDSGDKVVDNAMMPELQINDFIAFEETGAYSKTISTGFNGIEKASFRYFMERKVMCEMNCPALEKFCIGSELS